MKVCQNPEVVWELEMQIWDLDDRMLHKHRHKNKEEKASAHKKMAPIYSKNIINKTEILEN